MTFVLIALLLVFMGFTVIALGRGIAAFLRATRSDLDQRGPGATASQLQQNRMMINRIKFQALAVAMALILLAVAGGARH